MWLRSAAIGESSPARTALQHRAQTRASHRSHGLRGALLIGWSLRSILGSRSSLPRAPQVIPGAADIFVSRCTRASRNISDDSAAERSADVRSMTVCVWPSCDDMAPRGPESSGIALFAGIVSPDRACEFTLSLVWLWARVRRSDMVVNVFAKSFTRKAQCDGFGYM